MEARQRTSCEPRRRTREVSESVGRERKKGNENEEEAHPDSPLLMPYLLDIVHLNGVDRLDVLDGDLPLREDRVEGSDGDFGGEGRGVEDSGEERELCEILFAEDGREGRGG